MTENERKLLEAVEFLLDYSRRVSQHQVRESDLMALVHIRQLVKAVKEEGEPPSAETITSEGDMGEIVVRIQNAGGDYYLRGSVWTTQIERAAKFTSEEEAAEALEKAKKFTRRSEFKKALIVHI